jgi:hypothetical protein
MKKVFLLFCLCVRGCLCRGHTFTYFFPTRRVHENEPLAWQKKKLKVGEKKIFLNEF